ncbi:MAG: TlpA family protein disulfide reductase [Candidatus Marinimicrobia bacterium]|nr:TlpA family protein disulfide reductase [Candidatus Neomarinimicrobiota bacterium]
MTSNKTITRKSILSLFLFIMLLSVTFSNQIIKLEKTDYAEHSQHFSGYPYLEVPFDSSKYEFDDFNDIDKFFLVEAADTNVSIPVIFTKSGNVFYGQNHESKIEHQVVFDRESIGLPGKVGIVDFGLKLPIRPVSNIYDGNNGKMTKTGMLLVNTNDIYIGTINLSGAPTLIGILTQGENFLYNKLSSILVFVDRNHDNKFDSEERSPGTDQVNIKGETIKIEKITYDSEYLYLHTINPQHPDSSFNIGFKPPNIELEPLFSADPVFFADIMNEHDQIIVLNWWFGGCIPCRLEIPYLNELVAEYSDRKEVILNISFGEQPQMQEFSPIRFITINPVDEKSSIIEFLSKNEFLYEQFICDKSTADKYGMTSVPQNIVINRNGDVIYHNTGFAIGGGEDTFFKGVKAVIDEELNKTVEIK